MVETNSLYVDKMLYIYYFWISIKYSFGMLINVVVLGENLMNSCIV